MEGMERMGFEPTTPWLQTLPPPAVLRVLRAFVANLARLARRDNPSPRGTRGEVHREVHTAFSAQTTYSCSAARFVIHSHASFGSQPERAFRSTFTTRCLVGIPYFGAIEW